MGYDQRLTTKKYWFMVAFMLTLVAVMCVCQIKMTNNSVKTSYEQGFEKGFDMALDTMQKIVNRQLKSGLNGDTVTEIKFSDTLYYDFSVKSKFQK